MASPLAWAALALVIVLGSWTAAGLLLDAVGSLLKRFAYANRASSCPRSPTVPPTGGAPSGQDASLARGASRGPARSASDTAPPRVADLLSPPHPARSSIRKEP